MRNAFIGEKWGTEEIAGNNMPFKVGQPFHIQIITEADKFIVRSNIELIMRTGICNWMILTTIKTSTLIHEQILVDSEYYTEFAFRSENQVDNVEVSGEVLLQSCTC